MSDLIKRKDVLDAICDNCKLETDFDRYKACGNCKDVKMIMDIPSAERKGEWIWSPRDTDGTVSGCCSNCSFSHLFIGGHTAQYNYCPNCGADMRGEDDGR